MEQQTITEKDFPIDPKDIKGSIGKVLAEVKEWGKEHPDKDLGELAWELNFDITVEAAIGIFRMVQDGEIEFGIGAEDFVRDSRKDYFESGNDPDPLMFIQDLAQTIINETVAKNLLE
jgi:hypothetical protein